MTATTTSPETAPETTGPGAVSVRWLPRLQPFMVGSLFSGYGGLDLAVHRVFPNAQTAFVADIDPGACKILAHRFPGIPNLGDVTTIDWARWHGIIQILTAGFPCQDVSAAGKGAGLKRGTRTGLFHEVVRAIDELRPPLVLLENVRGLLSARGGRADRGTRARVGPPGPLQATDHPPRPASRPSRARRKDRRCPTHRNPTRSRHGTPKAGSGRSPTS